MVAPQKPFLLSARKLTKEIVEVSVDIQKAAWLCMNPKLGPGRSLQYLLKGAEAAWQSEKGIRKLGHPCLAGMHRRNAMQGGETAVDQMWSGGIWHHSNDLPAGS